MPVTIITGPRKSGKTTLANALKLLHKNHGRHAEIAEVASVSEVEELIRRHNTGLVTELILVCAHGFYVTPGDLELSRAGATVYEVRRTDWNIYT